MLESYSAFVILNNFIISNKIKYIEDLRNINHDLITHACELLQQGQTTIYIDSMEDEGSEENLIGTLIKHINFEHNMILKLIKLRSQFITY